MVQLLTAYRNYFREHTKGVLVVLLVTAIMWVLLLMGFLPTYDENELQRKAAYFFPVWIILAITALAIVEENIRSPATESPKQTETPAQ
ncbi:hypothetical protein GPJ56_003968 [Histomonas meleagridis]|uniref:uncharacterized protein n=1 Tax=Histomonas meleagridis TaxID=135588 RepID=UPI00355A54C6|nr:hypothetical protein GPJ56_003968 [Histomonas meleagridis]KAH0798097.1 hypothetical protein GO595_009108 [Histomonas meleagridis]